MRPEKQLQCIQCDGNSFPLDIFEFPSFSYVQDTRLYHWSFMEGHSDHWNTYLSCIYHIRGDIPPQTIFLFVSCSLNPEPKPFIIIRSSSDYSRSQPRPKAQYIIWALNPTSMYHHCVGNNIRTLIPFNHNIKIKDWSFVISPASHSKLAIVCHCYLVLHSNSNILSSTTKSSSWTPSKQRLLNSSAHYFL